MDPIEITKDLPEAVSIAKVAAASLPFTDNVKRMLGPAADELAEMWRDQLRVYRYGQQVKLLEKFDRIINEAGFTAQAVPPKILFPLLEGASFEEDEGRVSPGPNQRTRSSGSLSWDRTADVPGLEV